MNIFNYKSLRTYLLIVLAAFHWSHSAHALDPFDDKNLEKELQELSNDLNQRYSNENTLFLGIGRSPSIILGHLQIAHNRNVLQLPYSNQESVSPFYFTRVRNLIAERYPNIQRIVLVDYVASGQSMVQFLNGFSRVLRQTNISVSVYALTAKNVIRLDYLKQLIAKFVQDVHLQELEMESSLRSYLFNGDNNPLKKYALYEQKFGFYNSGRIVSANPQYFRLLRHLFRQNVNNNNNNENNNNNNNEALIRIQQLEESLQPFFVSGPPVFTQRNVYLALAFILLHVTSGLSFWS